MTSKKSKFVSDLGAALDRIDEKYGSAKSDDGWTFEANSNSVDNVVNSYRKLVDGSQRNTRYKAYELVQLRLDADLMKIIRHEASKRGKSWGLVANYLLWSGFFANRGDFRPPHKTKSF